jgi:myo-inositol 2-dehydrogenase/D-chiro-inositol 1-dehydrogenase
MGGFHAENLAGRVPAAALVRVVDENEDRARRMGDSLGIEWSSSFKVLLDDPEVEAVVIATPTPLHPEMIQQAAQAGKHIFCEKPVSFELDSTVQSIEAVRSAGVMLQMGFHRRFDPDWAAAVDRIRKGDLGDVYLFRTST